jgi:hypothetical protein
MRVAVMVRDRDTIRRMRRDALVAIVAAIPA